MSKYSEKNTDHLMLSKFEEVFGCSYYTSGNDKLFDKKIPDGWFEYDGSLFIIENKSSLKQKSEAYKQIIKYYKIAKETEEFKKYKDCYLIIGCGTRVLKYFIYSTSNDEVKITKKTLEDLKTSEVEKVFDSNIVHGFNQYLQDNKIYMPLNTKLFFVVAILLCHKINPRLISFLNEKDEGFIIADYMNKLIGEYYKDKIFSHCFEFMKYNLNNKHLYNLIKFLDFDYKLYINDILNQFYSEFITYDDISKKVGIVLTPHDIVEIMVKELNIKQGESVADFCMGTGSFLIEASKYTDKLFGCEKEIEMYTLAKCNFILHNLETKNLYFNNCFNQKFELYDHIILNPPFSIDNEDDGYIEDINGWRDFNEERKFIIYQLQYLKENGTGCFIIPKKNFNNSLNCINKFKNKLLEFCDILKLYICNKNIFYPIAKPSGCIICVFKKNKTKNFKTKIIDYTNDGYDTFKNKRIKVSKPVIKSYDKILTFKDIWYYKNIEDEELNDKVLEKIIKIYNAEKNYIEYLKLCEEYNYDKFTVKEYLKYQKPKEWIEIKFSDYFDCVKPLKTFIIRKTTEGEYPLISSSSQNNGIVRFINSYSVDIKECLTIARNGTAGSCFYHKGKIAITGDVIILKLKENKTLDFVLFSVLTTYNLTKKYNWGNKLTNEKLMDEIICYPIFE